MSDDTANLLIFIGITIISITLGMTYGQFYGWMTLGCSWTVWGMFYVLLNYLNGKSEHHGST